MTSSTLGLDPAQQLYELAVDMTNRGYPGYLIRETVDLYNDIAEEHLARAVVDTIVIAALKGEPYDFV